MSNFDNEMVIKIIDVTIEEYKEQWANSKYPYPSISMMCSWISNKAVEIVLKETEQDAETEELIEMAETSNNNFDFDSL